MKKVHIIMLLTLFLIFNGKVAIQAQQCFDFYRTTPNGTNVKACKGGGYSSFQVQQADVQSRTYAIEVLEGGTDSYNCHAYAWHVSEGGDKVWINNMNNEAHNVDSFWLDNSYFQVPFLSGIANLKVFYGSTYFRNDHSAVTTTDPNVFISKMGCGALVKHYKNNSPYDHSNLKYYVRSPSISGPTTVCDQATYTIQNLPSGATVRWSANNDNLELISGQGTGKAVFRKKGNWNDRIRAKIIIGNITRELELYSVWIGPPHPISYIYGMTPGMNVYPGEEFTFMVNEGSPLLNYRWDIYNGTIIEGYYNSPKIRVKVDEQTYGSTVFSVGVSIWNSCGSVPEFRVERVIVNNQSFTLSPNPATDRVTLQLMETDKESGESILSTARSMYEIQLWSGMRMLRSYKTNEPTFQIPVSGLPAGLYFVRVIKDGQAHTEKLMIKK